MHHKNKNSPMIHNLILMYFIDYLYKSHYNIKAQDVYLLKLFIDKYQNPDVCFMMARMKDTVKVVPVNPESFKKMDYGLYKIDVENIYDLMFLKNNIEKGTVRIYTKHDNITVKYNTFSGKSIRVELPIEKVDESLINDFYGIILNIASLSEDETIYHINNILELYSCLHTCKLNPNSVIALAEREDNDNEAKCLEITDESQLSHVRIISKSAIENLFDFEQYLMIFVFGLNVFEKASAFFSVFNEYPNWAVYSFYTEVDKDKIINYYSLAPIDNNFKITPKPNVEVESNEELHKAQVSINTNSEENM